MQQNNQGFSLLELLTTLSIISLLIAISIPAYNNYSIHEKRLEAAAALSKLAIAMEEYQLEHHSYEGATLAALKCSEFIVKNNYQLQISTTTETYLLSAIPQGYQAEKDVTCATLTLNNTGEKNITGIGKLDDCW